ncbi:PAS domain-containing sensor histidine kinase [Pirellulaceae bacterium SH449]
MTLSEQALQASHSRLRNILDSIYGFVGVLSLEAILLEANRAPLEIAGLSREQVIGKPFWETHWWSYSTEVQDQLRAAIRRAAAGDKVRYEVPVRAKGDELIIIDVSFEPLRNAKGEIYEVIGFASDITDRKNMETLLWQNKRSLRHALDAVPAQIAVLNKDGVINLTNQAWKDFAITANLTWRQVAEGANYLLACEHAEGLSATEARDIARGIRQVISGECAEFMVKYECVSDGSTRWFLCRGRGYGDQGSERIILVHTDITVLEQAELQLEELRCQLAHASRVATMGEMAAGIAHELNQPLTAIALYSGGCLEKHNQNSLPPEILKEKLESIMTLAKRCGQIILGLRTFVTRTTKTLIRFDVRDCFQAVLALTQHEFKFARVRCDMQVSPNPLPMMGDPVQIQQVLLNLIRNAIEAIQDSNLEFRRILVASTLNNRYEIEITIQDFGQGISKDVLDRLYEPFFTTKSNGMGMGLKVSRSIVRAHGGDITCQLQPNCGTTFRITLPVAKEGGLHEQY